MVNDKILSGIDGLKAIVSKDVTSWKFEKSEL
jgi:hypothetical protein